MSSRTRFQYFPRTMAPPDFVRQIVDVFRAHSGQIGTVDRTKGLTSDQVLSVIAPDLTSLDSRSSGASALTKRFIAQSSSGTMASRL